ncbi:MAG TPA: hypothetical protein PKV50_07045 [Prolixibacteraceae bacterium]|nr:hypothetical protein [Prolixibacteraceae bacterium]HQN94701.1 hypothetical protein [Prolixibacteraceae bacterium]HUM89268.1 hypothetical protein [Prolixibacteraceae bacterium]
MLKKILPLVIMLTAALLCSAQELDELIKEIHSEPKTQNKCLQMANMVMRYLNEDKADSVHAIISRWENSEGTSEPIFRAKMLLALKEGKNTDSLTDKNTIDHIFKYISRIDLIQYNNLAEYEEFRSDYGNIEPGGTFDQFTWETASTLKHKFAPNSLPYLWCEFYGENCDTLLSKIQGKEFANTMLAKQHSKQVNKYLNYSEFHIALLSGLWIPTGELKVLGIHPEIGLLSGWKKKKMNYDLAFSMKFCDTPKPYWATRHGKTSPEQTQMFIGGYFAFETSYDLISHKKHSLQLATGIGIDGFDAFRSDSLMNLEAASTNTFNFNAGFSYRYFYKKNTYIGARVKYNIVDYTRSGVIDLTGNTLSFQVVIGGLENSVKYQQLDLLRYPLRGH